MMPSGIGSHRRIEPLVRFSTRGFFFVRPAAYIHSRVVDKDASFGNKYIFESFNQRGFDSPQLAAIKLT